MAELAKAEQSDIVAQPHGTRNLRFGPECLIPKPLDRRLVESDAPAVAKEAMDTGVAGRPNVDFAAYREKLTQFVDQSGLLMNSLFQAAKKTPKRIVFARRRGRTRAAGGPDRPRRGRLAQPILIGRPTVLAKRIARYGLRLRPGEDFAVMNPEPDSRYRDYWSEHYRLTERTGISESTAKIEMRRWATFIGATAIHRGDADGLLRGTVGTHGLHLHFILGASATVCRIVNMTAFSVVDAGDEQPAAPARPQGR